MNHHNSPLSDLVFESPRAQAPSKVFPIGVLPGEGIGPDVIAGALRVLDALQSVAPCKFLIRFGGRIGLEAMRDGSSSLSEEVIAFCRSVFDEGGAVLNGPGGDRYVYDLRRHFDLFCKLSPLRVAPELADAGRLKAEYLRDTDILVVRENVGGLYQGEAGETLSETEGRIATQNCFYSERQTRRILEVGARIALRRQARGSGGKMTVVIKDGGIPTMSRLWRDCALEVADEWNVHTAFLNGDHAAYALIHNPRSLDVIVAPNLFGDVLADLGSILLGSRGLSFSGNFATNGAAVYQTNHGSGYDLVGTNRANPVGQIFSLAMLLRESFGLESEAELIEAAVAHAWRNGLRTDDLRENGCRLVSTDEMIEAIAAGVIELSPAFEFSAPSLASTATAP